MIIIGNEILSGRTVDANLSYVAKRLNDAAGIQMREARVIPDVTETIVATVNECRAKFDYVFTSGGIGPTHDDITSDAIAKAFGVALHRDPQAERILRQHYTEDTINEARLKMAEVPVGATLLDNPVSSAPGFRMENVFVMAGVPRICAAMVDAILPTLKGGAPVLTLSITTNLAEGEIAADLTAIQQRHTDIDIGSYPLFKQGELSTTLVLRSPEDSRNQAAASEIRAMIAAHHGREIVAVI